MTAEAWLRGLLKRGQLGWGGWLRPHSQEGAATPHPTRHTVQPLPRAATTKEEVKVSLPARHQPRPRDTAPIQNPSLQGKEPHTLAGPSRDGGTVKPKTGGQSEGGAAGAQRTGSPGRERKRKRKRKLPTESGPRVDRHGGAWPKAPLASPLLREVTLTSHHKGGADLTGLPLAQQGGPKP